MQDWNTGLNPELNAFSTWRPNKFSPAFTYATNTCWTFAIYVPHFIVGTVIKEKNPYLNELKNNQRVLFCAMEKKRKKGRAGVEELLFKEPNGDNIQKMGDALVVMTWIQHFHFTEVQWSLWDGLGHNHQHWSIEHMYFQFSFAVQFLEAPCVWSVPSVCNSTLKEFPIFVFR